MKKRSLAMKCPSCGAAKLVRGTRDISYIYKGETTTVPAVRGEFCPACGESVLAAAEAKRVSAAMFEFNKQVNASILRSTGVDPAFIARVRRKLALDQRQAAAVFGGGPNAFSRYENGKTKPPLALVKLLMLLDRHPKLLSEVRGG
jgi:HTH-type transcriptional regulator/antitoxin MqsA